MNSKENLLDSLDFQILQILQAEARTTYVELAKRLGLSAPAVTERMRKLEEVGIILGYSARLNPVLLEQGLLAFIQVGLSNLAERDALLACVGKHHAILECHHITGADDYLLKVRVCDTSKLEELLTEHLKKAAPGSRTHTTIALSSVKETIVQVKP